MKFDFEFARRSPPLNAVRSDGRRAGCMLRADDETRTLSRHFLFSLAAEGALYFFAPPLLQRARARLFFFVVAHRFCRNIRILFLFAALWFVSVVKMQSNYEKKNKPFDSEFLPSFASRSHEESAADSS